MSKAPPRNKKVKQQASTPFADYQGTTKIKKSDEQKETLNDLSHQSKHEHHPSIIAQIPLKKRLSVQFYPVEHVQFISNRLGKPT